jgi:ABC-type glycerol-3-phosphate transport system permease component
MASRPRRRLLPRGRVIFAYSAAALLAVVFLFPLYWLVGLSLKTRPQIFADVPLWIWRPTFENYRSVLHIGEGAFVLSQNTSAVDFLADFVNSAIVSAGAVVLSLVVGVSAGYAFSRYRFTGSRHLFLSLLVMRMLPPVAILVPMYVLFRRVGLLDTHLALVLAYTTFNLPLVVWIMRSFFEDLPRELEESAQIDGCTRFGAFWRVILPLARPGLATATIFSLILAWNDFLFAAVLTGHRSQTLPVMMAGYTTDSGIDWGNMTASAVIIILPTLLFALFAQKHLAAGLSAGAVKG